MTNIQTFAIFQALRLSYYETCQETVCRLPACKCYHLSDTYPAIFLRLQNKVILINAPRLYSKPAPFSLAMDFQTVSNKFLCI